MCAALMSSDSTSPLTTAQRPSNMSVTSSRVYVSSTSLCKQSFYGINPFFSVWIYHWLKDEFQVKSKSVKNKWPER